MWKKSQIPRWWVQERPLSSTLSLLGNSGSLPSGTLSLGNLSSQLRLINMRVSQGAGESTCELRWRFGASLRLNRVSRLSLAVSLMTLTCCFCKPFFLEANGLRLVVGLGFLGKNIHTPFGMSVMFDVRLCRANQA